MRVLAIDYGSKAIGVAICDELRMTVRPLTTIRKTGQSHEQIIEQLKNLVEENEVVTLIVGLPIRLDGSIGEAAERVKKFIAQLQTVISIPVIAQDERLTSREAEEMMHELGFDMRKRKEKSDEYAAAIILHDYLSSH